MINIKHKDSILNNTYVKRTSLNQFQWKDMSVIDSNILRRARAGGKIVVDQPHTPLDLINEINEQILINQPLDVSIGVFFTFEWAVNLVFRGYRNVTILTEKHDKFIENISNMLNIKYVLLSEISNLKFDIVVGNPPYADESKKGSYNSLWDKFVLRAYDLVKDTGQVVMVTPQTWFTQPRLNKGNGVAKVKTLIESNAVFVQTEGVAEHFNVGSTFSYYSIAKYPTVQVKVNGVTVQTRKLLTELKDEKELLIDKLLGFELFHREDKASAKGSVSKEQTLSNQAATVMTHKRDGYVIQYAEHASRLHTTPKAIFMVRTIHNRPIIDKMGEVSPPTGSTSSVYVFDTEQQLDNFGKLFDTKMYRFLVKGQRRHHGFLSSKTTSSVPKVDLTRSWTDEELYEYFNLTQEEIDLIESHN